MLDRNEDPASADVGHRTDPCGCRLQRVAADDFNEGWECYQPCGRHGGHRIAGSGHGERRDPEDQLRALIVTALDRHANEPLADVDPRWPATEGAADAVLAALADELPDGYDALLEHAHVRLARQPDGKET